MHRLQLRLQESSEYTELCSFAWALSFQLGHVRVQFRATGLKTKQGPGFVTLRVKKNRGTKHFGVFRPYYLDAERNG